MAAREKKRFSDDDEASYLTTGDGEICRVCHQEYTGACPLNSANCPFNEDDGEKDEFEDEEEAEELPEDDEEADRVVDEAEEIPEEDLKDDES